VNSEAEQPYLTGYNGGYSNGFDAGFHKGYEAGVAAGHAENGTLFSGTSIVIPTYNQLDYLKQCVQSIWAHTPEQVELIIIDNGSVDGTEEWLKSEYKRLRYRLNKSNRGFAGAVNQGLRMARGTTIVILNNDTLVTQKWLANLLHCVYSSPYVGLVGPVTNYISGEQLIPTHYKSIEEMFSFAEAYNNSNPAKWRNVSRITGFCLMMRREVFRKLGFFDEGFEIGNCEDDDYGVRARLLGYDLIVAEDTFIHHFGSVSIKAQDTRFEEFYQRNLDFFSKKWGDPHALVNEIASQGRTIRRTVDFYPSHMFVQGCSPNMYWIDNGVRYQTELRSDLPPVSRVSQLDLKSWIKGEPYSNEQSERILETINVNPELPLPDGCCVSDEEGRFYLVQQGQLRRFITHDAVQKWGMLERIRMVRESNILDLPQGLPIIPPPIIMADNI
jgi:O-antigen biosynthesis protein